MVLSFILLALGGFFTQGFAAVSLQFNVTTDKTEYKNEEPINITFTLYNKGKDADYVNSRFFINSPDRPKSEREVTLLVTAPDGKKLPCKFSYPVGCPKSDYFVSLDPGKEVSSDYPRNLKAYFDFDKPGSYQIVAVYENGHGNELGLKVFNEKLTAKTVTIKIIGSDSKNP
jgi:hypothetical protein